jgi:hypothetical protein
MPCGLCGRSAECHSLHQLPTRVSRCLDWHVGVCAVHSRSLLGLARCFRLQTLPAAHLRSLQRDHYMRCLRAWLLHPGRGVTRLHRLPDGHGIRHAIWYLPAVRCWILLRAGGVQLLQELPAWPLQRIGRCQHVPAMRRWQFRSAGPVHLLLALHPWSLVQQQRSAVHRLRQGERQQHDGAFHGVSPVSEGVCGHARSSD